MLLDSESGEQHGDSLSLELRGKKRKFPACELDGAEVDGDDDIDEELVDEQCSEQVKLGSQFNGEEDD